MMDADSFKELGTCMLGSEFHVHREVGSTNDVAKGLAREGAGEGTVVIAGVQKGGKGRFGREWLSPEGGVWMSVVLRPGLPPGDVPILTLAGGLALAKAIRGYCGLEVGIKWPNDILIGERKVAGILTEAEMDSERVHFAVMGMGINANFDPAEVFPPEVAAGATSLMVETGREVDLPGLVMRVIQELDAVYLDMLDAGPRGLLEEWKELASTLGREVRVRTMKGSIEGRAVDITPDGALLLRMGDGRVVKVVAGECIHLRYQEKDYKTERPS
ncbi:MAG: biotin--[acetyl-CoA-carboxylase] ligase [Euryarchaeota archaeon]|nr:biotin--[acetyl-CoA-carboxylase] ligase [Euryarchaeota archaeon]